MDLTLYKFMIANQLRTIQKNREKFWKNEAGLADAVEIVKALGMIVVIGAIIIFVADRTVTATGTPSNTNLSAMQTNLLGAGQTGSSFVIILVIAFIGGIAIAYVSGIGGLRRR